VKHKIFIGVNCSKRLQKPSRVDYLLLPILVADTNISTLFESAVLITRFEMGRGGR